MIRITQVMVLGALLALAVGCDRLDPSSFTSGLATQILLKGRVCFVDCVIRKVHVQIVHIRIFGCDIGLGGEPGNRFLVQQHPHRVNSVE